MIDYLLSQFAGKFSSALILMGELESVALASKLKTIVIEQPIFIAGIARSGTTLLLNLLAESPGVVTHRYRDFPFMYCPILWSWYVDHFGFPSTECERPHKDRIRISAESPEAYEEPVWSSFFKGLHDPLQNQLLAADDRDRDFDSFFKKHILKMLYLRGGQRYLSKGNYNLSRIAYLASLFPDARFIVPIRSPLDHVQSLVRQHHIFCGYNEADSKVSKYLVAAGHYEFGWHRRPINFDAQETQRVVAAWDEGRNALGYAIQWAAGYRYVHSLLKNSSDNLSGRIKVVRYEDLCSRPQQELTSVFDFSGLSYKSDFISSITKNISTPDYYESFLSDEEQNEVIDETQEVAACFDYDGLVK